MKLTRRQALTLAAATLAVGMTLAKPVAAKLTKAQWWALLKDPAFRQRVAASMVQPKRCGGLDYNERYENLQDLLVGVIRHAQETDDIILEANEPHNLLFRWIAVPKDGGWPDADCPITKTWAIMQGHIIVTGNRMDPRFKDAIIKVAGKGWWMTGERRRNLNAKAHLVRIPPNLAPCTPAPWSIYADEGVKAGV